MFYTLTLRLKTLQSTSQKGQLPSVPPFFGTPVSGGVRVWFCVRFQAVKASVLGGFPVENPTNKATGLKALLTGISLSKYGSEVEEVV